MTILLPRLSSNWRSLLRGDKDEVADINALAASRELSSIKNQVTTWSWRHQSWRFGGGKAGREAFDAFSSAVTAAAAQSGDDAVGEIYYEAMSSAVNNKTRQELEDAFGTMTTKKWLDLQNSFQTLRSFEIQPLTQEEWALDVDYIDPFSDQETEGTKNQGQDVAAWLVANIEALPERQLSTIDAALAARAAVQIGDDAELQARLFELFGFSEVALGFMTELLERRNAIATLAPTEIRAWANNQLVQEQSSVTSKILSKKRQSGSVNVLPTQSKQIKKKEQQRAAKEETVRKNKISILASSKYGELLEALGISLEDDQFKSSSSSHTETLLSNREREYHETRTGLPSNAERNYGEGYEEVVLHPPKKLGVPKPGELVAIRSLPPFAQACFPKSTKNLNRVQSSVYEVCFNSPKNVLVCAPTGAGKTYVALLCVLELIERFAGEFADSMVTTNDGHDDTLKRQQKEQVALALREHKIVYIAPLKALAQEVVSKFSERLRPLGLVVRELTGDTQLTKREADTAHVLVATPEKWDVVTRKQGTEGSLASRCRLLIIDEIHLLAEERGAVLECIVARTRRLVESSQQYIRLVGLSATLPNYLDVAEFLACDKNGIFFFGQEYRPVPLKQTFVGITAGSGDNPARARLKMAAKLDELAYEKTLDAIDRGHQATIFVHSRRDTSKTARYLRDRAAREGRNDVFLGTTDNGNAQQHKKDFSQALAKVRHSEMRELAASGLTVHHAGMCRSDRSLAEDMFARGAVRVLCCTATLAWGVNLPARAVICRGTEIYDAQRGGHVDLSMLDVLQIFGRAGRPQFDDFGEATLLTSIGSLPDYLRKLARAAPIESCLIPKLADALNAEVTAGTVSSIQDGVAWLDHTFLAVRLRKNPHAYGVVTTDNDPSAAVADHTRRILIAAAEVLDDARMTRFDRRSCALNGTDVGRVGSFYYLRHDSVRAFGTALEEHASDAAILAAVCSAHEFDQLQTRSDEVQELDRLRLGPACPLHSLRVGVLQNSQSNTDNIGDLLPGPLAKIIDEPAGKAATLFQAHVSRIPIQSFTLGSDALYVAKNAARVCRALVELAVRARFAGLAERLLQFTIAVERRVWWFQTPIRQLADLEPSLGSRQKNFPEDALKHLENKRVSLDRLLVDCGTTHDLTALVRNQRAAVSFRTAAQRIPHLDLECEVVPITRSVLRFVVILTPDYGRLPRIHGNGPEPWWLWVEDSRNGRLLHSEPIVLMSSRASSKKSGEPEVTKTVFTLAVSEPLPPMFFIKAISDRWLGATALTEVSSLGITLPSTAAKHTTLLPLHPLPTSALGVDSFAQLYRFSHFNPVQTQLFYCLYHTDRNVLLGAPTGSGKTCVAELAVMRMLNQRAASSDKNRKTKAVYVAPLKALARERLKDWRTKFGDMGLTVLELTGDATPDGRALREADILVTTPEKFDGVTRQFKRRDWVRDTALVILDEIHLLGEDRGPVIEAIVTRARFVADSSHIENNAEKLAPIRFIGLSTAISNAGDLAEWLGVDEHMGLYNFRPSVRPVPMETHIAGFPGNAYCPRMATMNKPCYKAIVEHAGNRPALVFVASRRQTRLTALELISIAGQDDSVRGGAAALWVDVERLSTCDELENLAQSCQDTALRETLPLGVGLHHAGLAEHDRDIVERVFASGKIRVLVCTATLAWGVNFPARLVVVKGTEYYDAKQHKYVDFPITDVLQMMGRAGRPQFDDTGIAVILVHAPKGLYRRFLYEPFPVESHLLDHLHNLINAEVCATNSISDADDAVAFLRYSYFYRRLLQNPSYYHLDRHDPATATAYLKQLVAATFEDLAAAGAIELEDDGFNVKPATLGRIAAYYYLDYKTTRDASNALDALEDELYSNKEYESAAIQFLCAAREFDELPVRHNEDLLNEELAADLNIPCSSGEDPHFKAQLLIHARLRSVALPIADYVTDTRSVLEQTSRVLAALIDVAADAGAIYTTLALCHLSQSLGTSISASFDELCQLPGVSTDEIARDLRSRMGLKRDQGIQDVLCRRDLLLKLLGNNAKKNTSLFIESLPTETRLQATVEDGIGIESSRTMVECDKTYTLRISLELHGATNSNGLKKKKRERLDSWWLILSEDDELIALKRVSLPARSHKLETSLVFAASEEVGPSTLVLRALAHDIRGFDTTLDIPLSVVGAQTGISVEENDWYLCFSSSQ